MSDRIFIEPYRRRALKLDQDVWVYRNLMRAGAWYSIVQRGLVVGHTKEIALTDVRFVVREGGRRRVLTTGVKNVHAFVVGRVVPGCMPYVFDLPQHSALRGRYNPRQFETFVYDAGGQWLPLYGAAGAHLGAAGLTVLAPS